RDAPFQLRHIYCPQWHPPPVIGSTGDFTQGGVRVVPSGHRFPDTVVDLQLVHHRVEVDVEAVLFAELQDLSKFRRRRHAGRGGRRVGDIDPEAFAADLAFRVGHQDLELKDARCEVAGVGDPLVDDVDALRSLFFVVLRAGLLVDDDIAVGDDL